MTEPNSIFLVEDNPADVELTLRALEDHAISSPVSHFRNGADAVDFFFGDGGAADDPAKHPTVILLDLKLPKVNGIEVLERLKGDERTRAIPIVVITSSREERDLRASYAAGANSYVVKPVEFADFSEVIGAVATYWTRVNERLPGA